jgi:MFS family permease
MSETEKNAKKKKSTAQHARTPAKQAYLDAVNRDFLQNAVAGILLDIVWFVGMAFVVNAVLVPSYLGALGAKKVIIGIVGAAMFITVPMNLFSDRLLRRGSRVVWFLGLYIVSGLVYVLIGLLGIIVPDSNNMFQIIIFAIGVFVFFITINLTGPIHWEVQTDTTPLRKKGRFFAIRIGLAAGTGFLMVQPAKFILSKFDGPMGFHIALIIGGSFFAISPILPMILMRDHQDPARIKRIHRTFNLSLRHEIYLLILKLWFRPNYRVFIFFGSMLISSTILGTFLITYANDILHVSGEGFQAQMKMVYMGTLAVGGFAVGTLADKWGFKLAIMVLGIFSAGSFVLASFATNTPMILIAYGLYACSSVFVANVMANLSLELMPNTRIRRLIAVMNLFCLPFNIAMPWICGVILDVCKSNGVPLEGYRVVFTIGIVMGLLVVAGMGLLVQEPRTGRKIVYRSMRRT